MDTTLEQLQAFFDENLAAEDVRSLRMRHHAESKDFKGSVFVELGSAEACARARALSLTHAGAVVRMESKLAALGREKAEAEARAEARKAQEAAKAAAAVGEGEMADGQPAPEGGGGAEAP